jgi:hypothetical protein
MCNFRTVFPRMGKSGIREIPMFPQELKIEQDGDFWTKISF